MHDGWKWENSFSVVKREVYFDPNGEEYSRQKNDHSWMINGKKIDNLSLPEVGTACKRDSSIFFSQPGMIYQYNTQTYRLAFLVSS
jgi:hypothetical protein